MLEPTLATTSSPARSPLRLGRAPFGLERIRGAGGGNGRSVSSPPRTEAAVGSRLVIPLRCRKSRSSIVRRARRFGHRRRVGRSSAGGDVDRIVSPNDRCDASATHFRGDLVTPTSVDVPPRPGETSTLPHALRIRHVARPVFALIPPPTNRRRLVEIKPSDLQGICCSGPRSFGCPCA